MNSFASPSNSPCALCPSTLHFFLVRWQRQRTASARRRLAFRTEIAASSGDDGAPDQRLATVTTFSLAGIRPMVPLIFSRLARGVKKIGNGGSAQHNRFTQDLLQHAPQSRCLLAA